MKTTKTSKVIAALQKSSLTASQIASRFSVPNVRAMMHDIKRKNYNVFRSLTPTGLTKYFISPQAV